MKEYISEIEVYYGKFLSHPVFRPLANKNYPHKSKEKCHLNSKGKPVFKRVIKTEEKGSDVNLAIHLLNDAWLDSYDCAVLVSNDSDIAGSLSLIKENHPEKEIGLILPFSYPSDSGENRPSKELLNRVKFVKQIRKGVLANSQLPDTIPNTNIYKPGIWK